MTKATARKYAYAILSMSGLEAIAVGQFDDEDSNLSKLSKEDREKILAEVALFEEELSLKAREIQYPY